MASTTTRAGQSPSPSRPERMPLDPSELAESIPVETLVQYLLDAKRSLSSMTLVLRANDLVTAARHAHEESVILGAQAQFLHRGISDQVRLLIRVRNGMTRTYDSGKRQFKQVIKTLDAANGRLEATMEVLRGRLVERVFRPETEERRNLLDFVDVASVKTMQNALKENIGALQAIQTSFDGDLLRFDTDLRKVNKSLASASTHSSPSSSSEQQPVTRLLGAMMDASHDMAQSLASLTKHFDLCVTAVRTTEGGAALARRKAAEVTQSQGGEEVSISGVIAEPESHMAVLESVSAEDRVQMLQIVRQDAPEVSAVVQDITDRLQTIQGHYARLMQQTNHVKSGYTAMVAAFRVLEDVGSRLQSYIAGESEFRERWASEHDSISGKLVEMEELRMFYEKYASSYDNLILEVDRRRAHENKVLSIWRKAKDAVDKIIEADRKQRELFRKEAGDYIPTDLWPAMDQPIKRWEVIPLQDEHHVSGSTPALDKSVVQAAAMRLGRLSGDR